MKRFEDVAFFSIVVGICFLVVFFSAYSRDLTIQNRQVVSEMGALELFCDRLTYETNNSFQCPQDSRSSRYNFAYSHVNDLVGHYAVSSFIERLELAGIDVENEWQDSVIRLGYIPRSFLEDQGWVELALIGERATFRHRDLLLGPDTFLSLKKDSLWQNQDFLANVRFRPNLSEWWAQIEALEQRGEDITPWARVLQQGRPLTRSQSVMLSMRAAGMAMPEVDEPNFQVEQTKNHITAPVDYRSYLVELYRP